MYKLVGVDKREYGPVTREAVLEWIAQGRANGSTIARFEEGAWKPLQTFPEFQAALGVPPNSAAGAVATAPVAATWSTGEAPPYSGLGSQPRKNNWPAILGLIISILCCCCPFVGPILGLVLSIIGYSQIRSKPEIYSTSTAVAIAGICISILMIALEIVGRVMDTRLQSFLHQFLPNLPQ